MTSQGTLRAQKFISSLRALSDEEYQEHLHKCIQHEAHMVFQQAKLFGLKNPYSIQMTREDFDSTYAALKNEGKENPEAYLKHEADYLRELKNNSDPIGLQFIAEVKSARIKMAPYIAQKLDIPVSELEATLENFSNLKQEPGPNLTEDEKEYIAARRAIIAYSFESGIYASSAYEATPTSSWASRVKAMDYLKEQVRNPSLN